LATVLAPADHKIKRFQPSAAASDARPCPGAAALQVSFRCRIFQSAAGCLPRFACVGQLFVLDPKEFVMKILFINNEGGGFADHIEVEPNTSIHDLFNTRMKANQPDDYLIRVNRLPVAADYVLEEGDRVSFTPTKIEGARTVTI
jgi:hypothetical protein